VSAASDCAAWFYGRGCEHGKLVEQRPYTVDGVTRWWGRWEDGTYAWWTLDDRMQGVTWGVGEPPGGLVWNGVAGDVRLREMIARAESAESRAAGLALELKAGLDREEELRRCLAVVKTDVEGVWRWQGAGDQLESLSCPVVMSAATLRTIVDRGRDDRDARDVYWDALIAIAAGLGGVA